MFQETVVISVSRLQVGPVGQRVYWQSACPSWLSEASGPKFFEKGQQFGEKWPSIGVYLWGVRGPLRGGIGDAVTVR